MNASIAHRDFAPWEILTALFVSVAVLRGLVFVVELAESVKLDLPEVDKLSEVPVKVMPVLDEEAFEAAKLGGKKAVLPDMWQRAPTSVKKAIQEKPAPKTDVAAPSTAASEDPTRAPDKSKKTETVEDAGAETDAAVEGADAGLEESTADAGEATLDTDGGTPNGTGEPGCVGDGCTKDGKSKDNQAGQYVGRLIGFFKRGFSVSGLGLPPEEIAKLTVGVTVSLSSDGIVQSFTLGSSGNPTFDAGARAAMQAKIGQQVPNPPEDRPDLSRTTLSFTMTCAGACN